MSELGKGRGFQDRGEGQGLRVRDVYSIRKRRKSVYWLAIVESAYTDDEADAILL